MDAEPGEKERETAVAVLSGAKHMVRDAGLYQVWCRKEDWGWFEYAVNPAGDYIGDARDAEILCDERWIAPERRRGAQAVATCSVGFCARDQKWYGWSHRALRGFGIGDEAFLVQFTRDEDGEGWAPIPEGHGVKITTLEEARQSAENFAEDVS